MDFYTVLDQVVEMVRTRGRVSYQGLKLEFDLDDNRFKAVAEELRYAHGATIRDEGSGFVWTGESAIPSATPQPSSPAAERRHLTMLFCDVVDSTPLAGRFDPEVWREIMRAYYDACGKVIARFDGHIALYLGDGLLVYFGYPVAHENDAQRAVRAGLGMVEAIGRLNVDLTAKYGLSLAVRLGCHTGLVVVGELSGTGHADMALGETPNIAARLQGIAEPNTLVIGALTHQLLGGLFTCRSLGSPVLKGVAAPPEAYQVLNESTARTRLEALGKAGLTALVGRRTEMQCLEESWARVVDGRGQVLLLSGEAGIGKSRLVRQICEQTSDAAWLVLLQCSPFYQHTALHPVIDTFERMALGFERNDSAVQKMRKLEGWLVQNGQPLADTVPLFSSLLSIPLTPEYTGVTVPPDQLKQQTLQAIVKVTLDRAAQQPLLFVMEDLQWIDPTTVELLTLIIEQVPAARIMMLLTYRPDFEPPWPPLPHVAAITLGRLPPGDAAEMASRVAGRKRLPAEVMGQVMAKTDGVPLFVEELTKMLLESGLLVEHAERYELTGPLPALAIPNTLHDSLTARLDQLSPVKSVAQLAATLGREFSYALLRAVAPGNEHDLRQGLRRLTDAELLYEDGSPPESTYRFKHALLQDAAYQSLLISTRQHHHQRIARALESDFPGTVSTQPELLAHHYTEAGLTAQAIPYWLAAGQRALQHSANREAANHANRGLKLLATLPDTPERNRQEISLQILLGTSLGSVDGPQSVESIYARACDLARQVGGTPELFPALSGLQYAQIVQGHLPKARALAEEFVGLAEPKHDPLIMGVGHRMLAYTAWWQGDVVDVRNHSAKGLACYAQDQHQECVVSYLQDTGVLCGYLSALADWVLGYPTQAVQTMERTVAHARGLEHSYSVALTLLFSAQLAQLRRNPESARTQAEAALAISRDHGLDAVELWCLLPRGWALAEEGEVTRGISDICEALERRRALGIAAVYPWFHALLAEAYGKAGQVEAGLASLEEALGWVHRNDEHLYEGEVYRIRGELLLEQDGPDTAAAEQCFERALQVAREQQAKSWELRAATSLSRLWQEQGRRDEARELLVPVYDWFTEGFDTADLQDARALVDSLS
ncbi:AAA family ATPase [Aldersonia sp. NBC_00410]|uniref:AAA family ATPase n=1 Tax=Aldersonia sp. NBC_00410 TaxID=2975954 RepID=UPI002251ED1B|nr:AAA family ATPase [Aldersonia sp. NBC_00410]MCX5042060.1 AAA family ATPase [Aldersonia sp. NBC_00410]